MTLAQLKYVQSFSAHKWILKRYRLGCPTQVWEDQQGEEKLVSWGLNSEHGLVFSLLRCSPYTISAEVVHEERWTRLECLTKNKNGLQMLGTLNNGNDTD